MSGGLIVYLACLWAVMIIAGIGFAWWLRELGKQPPGPIQRAVIDLLWHAMRRWQAWRRKGGS